MAVSKNLWLDGTKQKLGGAVTYTLKGQQIIRKEAAKVFNPRTTAQMNQRVRLANLVNFYRANQSWMKRGAFENKKQTQSDYNAFVSRNISTSNIALTKAEALAGAVVTAEYKVTDGSLPMANVTHVGQHFKLEVPGLTTEDSVTLATFSRKLIEAYPGLKNGDQVSLIVYLNKVDGNGIPRLVVYPMELILNTSGEGNAVDAFSNSGVNFYIAAGSNNYLFTITTINETLVGCSICFSRSTSSGLKVSPSVVVLDDPSLVETYSSEAQFALANASYGDSAVNFLDSTTVVPGDSNTPSGGDDEGGSGSGDPGDVNP